MSPAAPLRVLLGVAGGIAAYKSAELLRRLTEAGHAVRVLPTASALEFVGAATFEALSGQPVHTGVFTDVPRCRTSDSASRPISWWSRRPPPTCWPGRPTAGPTTCSPPPCSPPAARC